MSNDFLEQHQNEIAVLSDFWSENTPRIIVYVKEEDLSNLESEVYITGAKWDWEFEGQRFDLLTESEKNHVNAVLVAVDRQQLE